MAHDQDTHWSLDPFFHMELHSIVVKQYPYSYLHAVLCSDVFEVVAGNMLMRVGEDGIAHTEGKNYVLFLDEEMCFLPFQLSGLSDFNFEGKLSLDCISPIDVNVKATLDGFEWTDVALIESKVLPIPKSGEDPLAQLNLNSKGRRKVKDALDKYDTSVIRVSGASAYWDSIQQRLRSKYFARHGNVENWDHSLLQLVACQALVKSNCGFLLALTSEDGDYAYAVFSIQDDRYVMQGFVSDSLSDIGTHALFKFYEFLVLHSPYANYVDFTLMPSLFTSGDEGASIYKKKFGCHPHAQLSLLFDVNGTTYKTLDSLNLESLKL